MDKKVKAKIQSITKGAAKQVGIALKKADKGASLRRARVPSPAARRATKRKAAPKRRSA